MDMDKLKMNGFKNLIIFINNLMIRILFDMNK